MEASRIPTTAPAALAAGRVRQVVGDYVTLTKPKVQSLLLLTTVTTMFVAGDPSLALVFWTVLGGSLASGGAGAVNHWFDRDIDAQMARTATRPVPAGRISPRAALTFGIALAVLSFLELSLTVNVLAATLALSGFLGYVFVYTIWLKRSTPQNIVIGGAAGAVPPLVAWAAVTGRVELEALYLFAIVFYWTPPHFWALSLLMKDEYARVGVPMMPVVRGEGETRQLIVLYTVLLVALTLMPVVFGYFGADLRRLRAGAGRRLHLALAAAVARGAAVQRPAHLPVLPGLSGAAVLRHGPRRPLVDCQPPHGPPTRPQEPPDRDRRLLDHGVHVRDDLARGAGLHELMAELDDTAGEAPPAGEQLHLPNPSILPLLNAVGLSIAIIGVPISLILIVPGLALFVVTAAIWIRDARREMDELPLDHSAGH